MPRIPFQPSQKLITGNLNAPQVRGEDFGADIFGAVAKGIENVTNIGAQIVDRRNKDEADIFVSKNTSETRAFITKRTIELRKTVDGDITGILGAELEKRRSDIVDRSPNADATRRITISLNSMFGVTASKSIVGDEQSRVQRLIFQSKESHKANRSAVYDDFTQLPAILVSEVAEINNMDISEQIKRELVSERRAEIGFDAIQGLIDSGENGARQALSLLENPKGPTDSYLPKSEKQKMVRYANQQIRAAGAARDQEVSRRSRDRVIQQRSELNRLYDLYTSPDGLSMADLKESSADARTKQFMRNLIIGDNEGPPMPPSDERVATYVMLSEVVDQTSPEDVQGIEGAIRWYREERFINNSEMRILLNKVAGPTDKARDRFEKSIKSMVIRTNPLLGIRDPKGDELYIEAMVVIDNAVREAQSNDVPIYSLFDPTNKEYIGPQFEKFKRTTQQVMLDLLPQANPTKDKSKKPEEDPKDGDMIKNIIKSILGNK